MWNLRWFPKSVKAVYRAELLDADDEALCCSGLRPGPSLSSPQSSMSTSLRERGTDSVPETTPRRRPSPWAFNDSLRARRTGPVGLQRRKHRHQTPQRSCWKLMSDINCRCRSELPVHPVVAKALLSAQRCFERNTTVSILTRLQWQC